MILAPPAQHDHPYAGPVIEWRLTAQQIENICGRGTLACSWPSPVPGGPCYMLLPIIGKGGVGSRTQAALRRHEIAHCNFPNWHS